MSHPDDEGFEALFKPIQDLTRNWEVDLCLHLEEYINYIRQICGEKNPDMNFAQAAVLVQNSANIYSKKVDFLFTTVIQLLDTLSKKQKEAKNRESQEDEQGQHGVKRRKAAVVLETEDFVSFGEVCSDRTLTLNLEKEKQRSAEKKKPKIVLNAAIKVKAKEKTSCTVYNCALDIMGKKEEFRLNWRICSAGTLHEEFVINKSRFTTMEPVDFSVHLEDDNCSLHSADSGVDQLPPPEEEPPPLANSLCPEAPTTFDRESEVGGLPLARSKKPVMNTVDVNIIDWQPNDFNDNLPEKPTKKRKVVKLPPGLDNEKKRKHLNDEELILSFTITDVFFSKYKNCTFTRDMDFCYQSKLAAQHKRQLLLNHRAKYQAYLEKEAGTEQIVDFHGFYNENDDSDNEHDFEGFDNVQDDDNAPDVDIPLPDRENILDLNAGDGGWKGDDANTYRNEAMKTLEAYRSRKIDHGRMSDMARRVEEWHQKIMPKLEAAEQRSSFDIHAYGTKILDSFSEEIGCVKPFEEIVAGQPREEVARYFLSTLVLANQYNVEISETEPGDLNVDCVQLKLLSIVRHQDELDDNLRQTSDK